MFSFCSRSTSPPFWIIKSSRIQKLVLPVRPWRHAFPLAIGKCFVLSLYKCDTTRMVGRLFTPLQYTLKALPCMHNQLFSLKPTDIPLLPASHQPPPPPTYTYTAYISFIPPHTPTQPTSPFPPHIYLFNPHLIYPPTFSYTACISFIPPRTPPQPTSHLSPTYTYTTCISFIPPHTPTQPKSHLSPTYTYTA